MHEDLASQASRNGKKNVGLRTAHIETHSARNREKREKTERGKAYFKLVSALFNIWGRT